MGEIRRAEKGNGAVMNYPAIRPPRGGGFPNDVTSPMPTQIPGPEPGSAGPQRIEQEPDKRTKPDKK